MHVTSLHFPTRFPPRSSKEVSAKVGYPKSTYDKEQGMKMEFVPQKTENMTAHIFPQQPATMAILIFVFNMSCADHNW